jgi:hypothetical protein
MPEGEDAQNEFYDYRGKHVESDCLPKGVFHFS